MFMSLFCHIGKNDKECYQKDSLSVFRYILGNSSKIFYDFPTKLDIKIIKIFKGQMLWNYNFRFG